MALRFDDLLRDLRLAARGLWCSPRFTTAVVLTLAIGTGATTALFSVVDAVLIRPLPYPNSDRIVRIQGNGPQAFVLFGGPRLFQLSVPELGSNGAIQHVGVYQVGGLNLGVEPAVRLRAAAVSPPFFEVMGINAARGRTFSEVERSAQIAVLSDRTWRARFGGDPSMTSRAIVLNGRPFEVVGVMPAAFDFPTGTEIWIPSGGDAQIAEGVYTPGIVARLVPAVSYQQARDAIGRTRTRRTCCWRASARAAGSSASDVRLVHPDCNSPSRCSVKDSFFRPSPRLAPCSPLRGASTRSAA
jgi:hypothetical protein